VSIINFDYPLNLKILNIACILYSLALVALGGRPIILRMKPKK
jgi:hypothetical protein